MNTKTRKIIVAIIVVLVIAFLAFALPRLLDMVKTKTAVEPDILSGLGGKASYEIVNIYPHDPNCYTQGLVYENGLLYESCGLYGKSRLRVAKLEDGETLREIEIEDKYFAEGLALLDNQLTMLTWQEGTAFIFQKDNYTQTGTFNYSTEGWGLTTDGNALILSDGSNTLYWMDPKSGLVVNEVHVTLDGNPMSMLNELEFVNGEILANVYLTDTILRIDPISGEVLTQIDLSGLMPDANKAKLGEVLNGIAWDNKTGRLFVTGKNWDVLYEIQLVPAIP
ncbi:MAG TPA: glutaminyl-peptide cyclotransferase [Anaerolineaceae bacterium]|nr:glutaminyl-peptide cyclotransferase [Anaerolineaceae bacterium]